MSRSSRCGSLRVLCLLGVGIVVAACATSSSGSTGGASKQFPASIYSPKTFNGLSGNLEYYDESGGAVAAAKQDSVFADFTKLTGVTVAANFTDGSDTKFLAAEQNGGSISWDLIEMDPGAFLEAEHDGYLDAMDTSIVPVQDLATGTYNKYGYQTEDNGEVLAWNTKVFPLSGKHPTSVTDLYNMTEFPGKRCIANEVWGEETLESALLADGVPRTNLYPLDVNKALSKLATISKDVVWTTSGTQADQDIIDGECVMGMTFNGRVYQAITTAHEPIAMTWGDALYTYEYWAVPKGAPDPKLGQAMLAFWILDHPGQIKYTKETTYATAGIKGLPLSAYPASVRPYMAVGANLADATIENETYYAANQANLTKIFDAWIVNH
jgi:putative spermidine/putrescine transport system substrate-binding protein